MKSRIATIVVSRASDLEFAGTLIRVGVPFLLVFAMTSHMGAWIGYSLGMLAAVAVNAAYGFARA